MAQAVHEAALKPTAAESYPYLQARMWAAGGRLAELVAKYLGIPAEAGNRLDRVLSDQDFMFRGGGPAPAGRHFFARGGEHGSRKRDTPPLWSGSPSLPRIPVW